MTVPPDILLSISNLSKRLGTSLVFDDFGLDVKRGEIVALVGPSGCGKTTLLRLIADLLKPDRGQIQRVLKAGPGGLSYMPQDGLLLPWRSLQDNSALPGEVWGMDLSQVHRNIADHFEALQLADAAHLLPAESSGGMTRRAAFVRALVGSPRLLLLDEPFSGLDYDIKLRAHELLMRHHAGCEGSVVLVTHDLEDAVALANRVVILTPKPARIKSTIRVQLEESDPIARRTSPPFAELVRSVWNELQYLRGSA